MAGLPQGTAASVGALLEGVEDWLRTVRREPVSVVELTFAGTCPAEHRRYPGLELNGALWEGLKRTATHSGTDGLQSLAVEALATHDRAISDGRHRRTLVLRIADGDSTEGLLRLRVYLILHSLLAHTWPAWVEAAGSLRLRGLVDLHREDAVVYTSAGPREADDLSPEDRAAAVLTLSEFCGPAPDCDSLRCDFVTPTVLESQGRLQTWFPSLDPLVVSALSGLSSTVGRLPAREVHGALRTWAADCAAVDGDTEVVTAFHWAGRSKGAVRGVVGWESFAQVPDLLREVLWLAQLTHLGQHSAYGLGWFGLAAAEE